MNTKPRQQRHRQNEQGNVLFVILIAIALLASLTYAITQGSRSGTSGLTGERRELAAGEIITYGNALANTTGQLRLRGCSPEQISFDNNISAIDYENGSAPGNNTCHIFHPDGGGMTYQNVNDLALESGGAGLFFDGSNAVQNIGTTCASASCADMAFYVRDLTADICKELNTQLSITNPSGEPPVDDDIGFTAFTGAYSYSETLGDNSGSDAIAGAKSACLENDNDGSYNFYRVLVSR